MATFSKTNIHSYVGRLAGNKTVTTGPNDTQWHTLVSRTLIDALGGTALKDTDILLINGWINSDALSGSGAGGSTQSLLVNRTQNTFGTTTSTNLTGQLLVQGKESGNIFRYEDFGVSLLTYQSVNFKNFKMSVFDFLQIRLTTGGSGVTTQNSNYLLDIYKHSVA